MSCRNGNSGNLHFGSWRWVPTGPRWPRAPGPASPVAGCCPTAGAATGCDSVTRAVSFPSMSDVTRILNAIEAGDPTAADQLLPLVYGELRKLAAERMAREKPGQTLDA